MNAQHLWEAPAAEWLLPASAYTSREWFDREQEQLIERCWAFVGMESDVPAVGDYVATQVGRVPIVVVRSECGLNAFHNVCRHRGAVLLEGRGTVRGGISCFYHRWRYSIDGALSSVPQRDQFPDLCMDDLALVRASVATAKGMVFVHVDASPPQALDEWLGDVVTELGPLDPSDLYELPLERHEMRANWKLFVENHIDGYHLWHLHARSIKGLDHGRQRWRPAGRHWIFDEPPTKPGTFPDRAITGLPLLPTTPTDGFGSVVMLAFPNLGIAVGATFFVTVQAIPTGPTTSTIELRTRIAPMDARDGARLAIRDAAKAARRLVSATSLDRIARRVGLAEGGGESNEILMEDLRAAEAVQRGMASPTFRVGPMARDHEQAITVFQRNVLDHLGHLGHLGHLDTLRGEP